MANLSSALRTFTQYPGFVLMRSVARFDLVRKAVVRAQTALREPVAPFIERTRRRPSEFFPGADPIELTRVVEHDGFALGLSLPQDIVRELVEFARTHHCWANRDPALGYLPQDLEEARRKIGRGFLLGHYFNIRRRSGLVSRLAEDPVLLEVAARYLGTVPKLVGAALWWSYPEDSDDEARNQAAQMFHFDLDDFKFIKYFFYLTDVDATSGPHVIVRATHRNKRQIRPGDTFKVRRYSDSEIEQMYGRDRIVPITGPAGTCIIEDTLSIHKGAPPTGRERLVFQLQYALNDFGNQTDEIDEARLKVIA
jgi:hypothetical protein